jgi:copper chaperone CopZ
MLKFEALHVPALTPEVAERLESSLRSLPGIEKFKVSLETHEIQVVFDESQLGFLTLTQAMATAGCPLRNISAALLKDLSKGEPGKR